MCLLPIVERWVGSGYEIGSLKPEYWPRIWTRVSAKMLRTRNIACRQFTDFLKHCYRNFSEPLQALSEDACTEWITGQPAFVTGSWWTWATFALSASPYSASKITVSLLLAFCTMSRFLQFFNGQKHETSSSSFFHESAQYRHTLNFQISNLRRYWERTWISGVSDSADYESAMSETISELWHVAQHQRYLGQCWWKKKI
jgi:hypothetical protein